MRGRCIALLLGGLMLLACGCGRLQRLVDPAAGPSGAGRTAADLGARLVYDGFAIVDFRAMRDQHDRVHIVGEVKNVSEAARGVELQATLRDAGGHVLAVGSFYPASNHNIMPDEAWPFSYSFGRYDEGIRAELRIVGGFRTIETLRAGTGR